MKSNKVLLGLFAGLLTLVGGAARAQFYEIGPTNVAGQVSSLVIDKTDANHTTIYAGAISGGLYVRTEKESVLQTIYSDLGSTAPVENLVSNHDIWHYVTCKNANGEELPPLPISAMVQGDNGEIYIGTGDNTYPLGSTLTKMSSKGRGIYRYNPTTGIFQMIAATNPANTNNFDAVRGLDYIHVNDTMFFFAATNTGVYRWAISDANEENDWAAAPKCVLAVSADNILVSRSLGVAYFSSGNQLYRIGNVTAPNSIVNAVNISSSNTAFGGSNKSIKLAMAPSNNRYLYAMVIDTNGYMENVYLTTNGQNWSKTATESVLPMTYNSGVNCGSITVDPWNEKRIIIGGTGIWIGQGHVEGSYYIWTKSSRSEFELNGGDYMGMVFNSSFFVHSGIHQIIPTYTKNSNGDWVMAYYMATDGGVFCTKTDFNSYDNLNLGLNNVQINSLAVCPDGSILSGAVDNACPFIESRMAHHGGNPTISWFDYGAMGNLNHNANVIWTSTGRDVAASAFYQIGPQKRRNIFVSSVGRFARSYTDYLDFTNTTTWNIDSAFTTRFFKGAHGAFSLWENENDSYLKDSIRVTLDLRGYYFSANGDTTWINQDASHKVKTGEKAVFLSKNNSEYPFEYTFTAKDNGKSVADTFLVKNPVVSRAVCIAKTGSRQEVQYTWMPNDFSHVWTTEVYNLPNNANTFAEKEKMMKWSSIFPKNNAPDSLNPRNAVLSQNGLVVFVSTHDTANHRSQLYRLVGFENVNFNRQSDSIIKDLQYVGNQRKLTTELFSMSTGSWFNRPISSIAVDPRTGHDRLVLTFDEYSTNGPSIVIINNATKSNWSAQPLTINGHEGTPVYCAIVEKTTGYIYVGTADGVFIYNGSSWSQYDHLKGIPVTAIVQQTKELPLRHHLTHTGIEANNHIFAKTKWPRAIYFGTYGRGIFMDTTYVTDPENEICDSNDYLTRIPSVNGNSLNTVSIYPNPVMGEANLSVIAAENGNATLRIYDLNGRCVMNRDLGYAEEGEQTYKLSTLGMTKGMYLVNVIIGGHTAATKMIVR